MTINGNMLAPEYREALKKDVLMVYRQAMEDARRDYGVTREWLTFEEVQNLMQISSGTLANWRKEGLPFAKIGTKYFINKKQLNTFIADHMMN